VGGGPVGRAGSAGVVVVLADDLIWAARLEDVVSQAGGAPRRARRVADLEAILASQEAAACVVVDLTARAYDGLAAIRAAKGAGARVVGVGQHDDVDLRRAAIEAGAERVFTYRAIFEDGPRLLGAWLAR
jgi:DNA-binding NtrC family response regulator